VPGVGLARVQATRDDVLFISAGQLVKSSWHDPHCHVELRVRLKALGSRVGTKNALLGVSMVLVRLFYTERWGNGGNGR